MIYQTHVQRKKDQPVGILSHFSSKLGTEYSFLIAKYVLRSTGYLKMEIIDKTICHKLVQKSFI
jgi:hypothetical protein